MSSEPKKTRLSARSLNQSSESGQDSVCIVKCAEFSLEERKSAITAILDPHEYGVSAVDVKEVWTDYLSKTIPGAKMRNFVFKNLFFQVSIFQTTAGWPCTAKRRRPTR